MDVHRIDVRSGAVTLDTRNPGTVTTWAATDDLVVKAGVATRSDGGEELLVRDSAKGAWRTLTRGGPDDTARAPRPHRRRKERALRHQRRRGDRQGGPARAVGRRGEGAGLESGGRPDRRLRPPDAARGRGRGVRARAPRMDPARPDGEEGLRRLPSPRAWIPRGRLTGPRRPDLDRGLPRRAGPDAVLLVRPHVAAREAPLRRPAEARIGPAGGDEAGALRGARRAPPAGLPDAAGGRQRRRTDGPPRPRRPVGA